MTNTRQLYALQELDTELKNQRDQMEYIKKRLFDPGKVTSISTELEQTKDIIKKLKISQRSRESDVTGLNQKIQQFENKLYSGSVVNLREMDGIRREVEILGSDLKNHENELLETMLGLEKAQKSEEDLQQKLEKAVKEHQNHQQELQSQQENIHDEIESLVSQRKEVADLVGEHDLKVYEDLRIQKGGVATAKVERGMCQVCRVTLPTYQMQQARSGKNLVHCNSCSRILHIR